MKIDRASVHGFLKDLIFYVLGAAIYSLGLYCFAAPNHITPGGVSGISVMVNYLTEAPIGIVSLCINIPLMFWAAKKLGLKLILKSFVVIGLVTVFTDFIMPYVPLYQGERILAALFEGVMAGTGIALVISHNATTGGTDFVTLVLHKNHQHLNFTKISMSINAAILAAAAIVYKDIDSALFGAIAMFVNVTVIDKILYGMGSGKLLLIITDKSDEIAAKIDTALKRGMTLLCGKGYYTKTDKTVILTAIRKNQITVVKKIVEESDPHAFITAIEAGEIIGKGFGSPL
ncbi:MAG: YitT family protein [Oscillospiraceae bacterium]